MDKPTITKCQKLNHILKYQFKPDYKRLGLNRWICTPDMA